MRHTQMRHTHMRHTHMRHTHMRHTHMRHTGATHTNTHTHTHTIISVDVSMTLPHVVSMVQYRVCTFIRVRKQCTHSGTHVERSGRERATAAIHTTTRDTR